MTIAPIEEFFDEIRRAFSFKFVYRGRDENEVRWEGWKKLILYSHLRGYIVFKDLCDYLWRFPTYTHSLAEYGQLYY